MVNEIFRPCHGPGDKDDDDDDGNHFLLFRKSKQLSVEKIVRGRKKQRQWPVLSPIFGKAEEKQIGGNFLHHTGLVRSRRMVQKAG